MAANGWYPDPGGAPNRYRYWNGAGWSAETTGDPRTPAPGPSAQTPGRPGRRRGPLIVVLALIVLLAIVVGVVVLRQPGRTASGPDEPRSTVSSYDDSSPFPTATPTVSGTPTPTARPSRTASPTPSDSAAPPPQQVACPDESTTPGLQPGDGRVHGGRLSFAQVDSYPAPEADGQFSWMADVTSQTQSTEPGWISIFAVGEVRTADTGFATPKQAAESSIQCAITEGWYQYFTGRTDLKNSSITVDGHSGWIIVADIRVDDPDIEASGDQLTFLVLDDGRSEALSVWSGMVPIGDTGRLELNDAVRAGLRVG